MTFSDNPLKRREARAQFELSYMCEEMGRLKKWRAEAELKEHREMARELKVRKKRREEEKKSLGRIQKLLAARRAKGGVGEGMVMRGGSCRLA